MVAYLTEFASRYHGVTQAILEASGVNDKLLHVHAGLAIMLLARLVSGRSLATFLPFAAVAVAEIGNEALDALFFGAWRWDDTLGDAANTLFWPLVLMVGLRLRRPRG
jgi:hypothetical protein